jgi:hypothetical protein
MEAVTVVELLLVIVFPPASFKIAVNVVIAAELLAVYVKLGAVPHTIEAIVEEAVPVAANEAGVATPATDAVKTLDPAVELKVGAQEATPLELVVEEVHPVVDAPAVVVAQLTAMPAPTVLPPESVTRA